MREAQTVSPRSPPIKKESRIYFAALGKRVTLLRKSRGMTQAEQSRALGVSQQAVFAYEIGDRRISVLVLEKIAKLFRLSTDQLLGLIPESIRKGRVSPRRCGTRSGFRRFPKHSSVLWSGLLMCWRCRTARARLGVRAALSTKDGGWPASIAEATMRGKVKWFLPAMCLSFSRPCRK